MSTKPSLNLADRQSSRRRTLRLTDTQTQKENHMSTKIIVSYDGTANEDDAIALRRAVRPRRRRGPPRVCAPHPGARPRARELAQHEAQELLERGTALLGGQSPAPTS